MFSFMVFQKSFGVCIFSGDQFDTFIIIQLIQFGFVGGDGQMKREKWNRFNSKDINKRVIVVSEGSRELGN